MGNQRARRLTLLFGGLLSPGGACLATTGAKHRPNPPDTERRAMLMYVTYSDLIQIGMFICTLIGLCYAIFHGKRK